MGIPVLASETILKRSNGLSLDDLGGKIVPNLWNPPYYNYIYTHTCFYNHIKWVSLNHPFP